MLYSYTQLVSIQPYLIVEADDYHIISGGKNTLYTDICVFTFRRPSAVRLVPDNYSLLIIPGEQEQDPFITAPTTRPSRTVDLPAGKYLCVKLSPFASYGLYRVICSKKDIADHVFPAAEFFPEIGSLQSIFRMEPNLGTLSRRAEMFLNSWLRFFPANELTNSIISKIISSNCGVTSGDLSAAFGYSERYIYEVCRSVLGSSPKTFSRIVRFQSSIYMIMTLPERNLLTIPYELNYYDQPHFLHEFRKLSGLLPSQMRTMLSQKSLP